MSYPFFVDNFGVINVVIRDIRFSLTDPELE